MLPFYRRSNPTQEVRNASSISKVIEKYYWRSIAYYSTVMENIESFQRQDSTLHWLNTLYHVYSILICIRFHLQQANKTCYVEYRSYNVR